MPFDPAISTVEVMVTDLPELKGIRDDQRGPSRVEAALRRRGEPTRGRPRVKVTTVAEMLEVIGRGG